ncbi:MAG: hypothetical protein Q4E22_01270 [Coriobacteriia bacterium]|nr:hypothetical protein [Coriobacteriia bacterium]
MQEHSDVKRRILDQAHFASSEDAEAAYKLKEYFPKKLEDVEYPDEFRPHDLEDEDPWEGFDDHE